MKLTSPGRLGPDTRGATALEFALVGPVFLFLLFAILEVGLIFVMQLALNNATSQEARLIRVGTTVAGGVGATTSSGSQIDLADIKSDICGRILLVPSSICVSQLQVDVRVINSFQDTALPNPYIGKTFSPAGFCLYSGNPGSKVVMRTYYLWPVITPGLLQGLVNVVSIKAGAASTSGQWSAISASEFFINEPNDTVSNTGANC